MGHDLCIIMCLKFSAGYLISKLSSLSRSLCLSLMFMKHSIKTHIYSNKSNFRKTNVFGLLQLVYISLALWKWK